MNNNLNGKTLRRHMEDLVVGVRIILKSISKENGPRVWIRLGSLFSGKFLGCFGYDNKYSRSLEAGQLLTL